MLRKVKDYNEYEQQRNVILDKAWTK